MGNETLISLNLSEKDLEKLTALAVKANLTTEVYLVNLIREKTTEEKTNKPLLNASQLSVTTLELVWQLVLDHSADFDALRQEIAGTLLKARIALMQEQNGKVDPEKVKEWVEELYT